MLLRFTKMHGQSNDFMVIDLVTQHAQLSPRMMHQWSDRRTGIGFDKVLIVEPPGSPEADLRYCTFDTEGNELPPCSDGIRCFTRFVQDKRLTSKPEIHLETSAGSLTLLIRRDYQVSIQPAGPDWPALLTGPATRVYEGQIRV